MHGFLPHGLKLMSIPDLEGKETKVTPHPQDLWAVIQDKQDVPASIDMFVEQFSFHEAVFPFVPGLTHKQRPWGTVIPV